MEIPFGVTTLLFTPMGPSVQEGLRGRVLTIVSEVFLPLKVSATKSRVVRGVGRIRDALGGEM